MFEPRLALLGVILLHISLIYGDGACGNTTFNDTTGELAATDPGMGKNCTYYIVASNYTPQVAIRFKAVTLDAAVFNLTVYGGNTTTSPVIANLTQVSQGLQDIMVISGYNVTTIVFSHANIDLTSASTSQFSASFDTTVCSIQEQSLGGVIQSPIYKPNNGSVNCLYTESFPLLTMVVVSFLNLNVSSGSVDVKVGTANKTSLTGTTLPADIFGSMDSTNELAFNINFNSSTDPQNFSASFQTIDRRCSGVFDASDDFQSLGIPQNNQLPVKCYAQINVDKKKIFVENGAKVAQKSSGFDSIVYYDGQSTQAPVIGTLGDGLNWFSSSGPHMTVVANLGARSSRNNDIQYRSDSFSNYYQITTKSGPITHDFDGASVLNETVRLQFESKIASAAMVKIEVLSSSSITDAIITIQCDNGVTKVTFTKGTQLFPVVMPSVRALVTISNLIGVQKVSLKATAVQAADCNQIFTEVTGLILLASASTKQTSCNLVIATGTDVILDLSQVNLCKTGTLDVYQGFNMDSPKIASLNATTSKVKIGQIWFPSGSGPRLVWKDSNNTCIEPTVVGRYWTQNNDDTCGVLSTALNGTVKTPNYPNQYPFNIRCNWTFPVTTNASMMYLSVNAIDFPPGQAITLQNNTKNVATISGCTLPADLIVPNKNLSLIFNSSTHGPWHGQSGQGTQLVYKVLTCGGLVTKYPANLTIPSAQNQSVECIWIIQVPATGANKSVNVVAASITVSGYKSAVNGTLEIHDGNSVRDPLVKVNMTQRNTTVIRGRSNVMVVRYAYTNSTSAPFRVNFTYAVYNCNSSSVCDNVTCILPGWRCNGVLDCKDGTDELRCNGSQPIPPVTTPMPAPGPGGKTGGLSFLWVVVCLAVGILLGVLVTVMVPKFIRRMRQRDMARASNYGSLHEDT